jgi:hypothetical protein
VTSQQAAIAAERAAVDARRLADRRAGAWSPSKARESAARLLWIATVDGWATEEMRRCVVEMRAGNVPRVLDDENAYFDWAQKTFLES